MESRLPGSFELVFPTWLGSTSIAHEQQAGVNRQCPLLTFAPVEQQEIEFNFSRANRLLSKLRPTKLTAKHWQTLLFQSVFSAVFEPKASSPPAELGQCVAMGIETCR